MSIVEQLEASGAALSPATRAAIEGLEATVATLQATVAMLQESIRELQARLGQNSTNTSLPPSSDPPGVARREKKPTGKKRGGQPGHPGHHRQLVPPARVDEVVVHRPEECRNCGHGLSGEPEAKRAWVHQVIELPPVRAWVTEHRMHCIRCPKCRKLTRAELPAQARHHFGSRMVAFASQLVGRYRVSRREAPDLLGQLLDLPPPSLGSMEAFTREMSAALLPAYGEVQTVVRGSDQAGVDETPWKLGGKKQWLWVAVTESATLFHLGASRGSDELRRFLGSAFRGTLSSDRWCAYQSHEGPRQLCWAHLKRNFKKLELRGGEAARFAKRGVRVCTLVFKTFGQVQEAGLGREQLRSRMRPIQEYFRRLVQSGASSAHRKVASMCRNLLKLWPSLWTFLEKDVELTNNAAERALRPAVLWRKGCFGNQSESGMRYAERILSVAATCRQQGIPLLDFLSRSISALRSGGPAPKILQAH